MLSGKLYQFVGSGLQTEMTTIHGWLAAMLAGRSPSLSKAGSEQSLYKLVIDRLPFFARETLENGKVKVGKDAIDILFKKVGALEHRNLEDLKPFARFNFLLGVEEKKQIAGWTATLTASAVSKAAGASKAGSRAGPSSSAGGNSSSVAASKLPVAKRKRKTDDEVLRLRAVKALFRN